jgi:hypothetical protein
MGQGEAPEALQEAQPRLTAVRAERDPFQLRPLPFEDLVFDWKRIDNSRLVREADPQSRGRCLSVIGVAGMALAMIVAVAAPRVANTLQGYTLENLRGEERRLLDDRRVLELRQAELRSPERLERLAQGRNLAPPVAGQVIHLASRPDSSVAMVK